MAKKNLVENGALTEQGNAAMQVKNAVNAHEQFVSDNLSQFSGKSDDLKKSSARGLRVVRTEHNLFNGMWIDTIKGQSDKNFKEFLSMPILKNTARKTRDHVRVAFQKGGVIEDKDVFYLGCEFREKSDNFAGESLDTLRKCIKNSYSKDYSMIVLGYQVDGEFHDCTDIDAMQITSTREDFVEIEKQNADGTFSVERKYHKDENGKKIYEKKVVTTTLVPYITEHMSVKKFIAALNAAIDAHWLLLFPAKEESNDAEKESK